MGRGKKYTYQPWDEHELMYLIANYNESDEKISNVLNRTRSSITNKRHKLTHNKEAGLKRTAYAYQASMARIQQLEEEIEEQKKIAKQCKNKLLLYTSRMGV